MRNWILRTTLATLTAATLIGPASPAPARAQTSPNDVAPDGTVKPKPAARREARQNRR